MNIILIEAQKQDHFLNDLNQKIKELEKTTEIIDIKYSRLNSTINNRFSKLVGGGGSLYSALILYK